MKWRCKLWGLFSPGILEEEYLAPNSYRSEGVYWDWTILWKTGFFCNICKFCMYIWIAWLLVICKFSFIISCDVVRHSIKNISLFIVSNFNVHRIQRVQLDYAFFRIDNFFFKESFHRILKIVSLANSYSWGNVALSSLSKLLPTGFRNESTYND